MDHIPAFEVQVAWLGPSMVFGVCDQYLTRSASQLGGIQLCIEEQAEAQVAAVELAVYPCMNIFDPRFVQMAAIVSQVELVVG